MSAGPPDEKPEATASERATRALEALLADATMSLLRCQDQDALWDIVTDFLGSLVPGSILIVNQTTPDGERFAIKAVTGLDETLLKKAADLVGFDVVGSEMEIVPATRDVFMSGCLTRFPGGLADLAQDALPRPVSEALAAMLGIRAVFTIGLADGENALGNIHILARSPEPDLPPLIVESFARQCYAALSRLAAERSIIEAAERTRLLIDSMTEGFALHEIILDDAGVPCDYRFLDVNPAFESLTGLSAEEIVGRRVREVLPGIEPVWIERYGAVASTGVPDRFEDYSGDLDRSFGIVAYAPEPGRFVTIFSDITDRKRIELTLEESEDKFRYLFDHSLVAISVTTPGGEIDVNQAFLDMLGYTRDEMAEKSTFQRISHPADVEKSERVVAELIAGEATTARFLKRYLHKDGSTVWADVSTALRRDDNGDPVYFVTTVVDITERKRAEDELRHTSAILQAAMDNSPAGIAIADAPDGALRYVNDAGLIMRGGDRDSIVNGIGVEQYVASWRLFDLDGRPLRDDEVPLARAIMFGEPASREFIIRRDDEEDRIVSGNAAPILDDDGRVEAAIVVFDDITERKEAEEGIRVLNAELEERVQERTEQLAAMNEELRVTNDDLTEANLLLEDATSAKSEFLASMSHELRTPLNSIIGFTGVLLQGLAGPVTAEQELQLNMVSESGKHLLSLIDGILDLSKIESGATTVRVKEFDVASLAGAAMEMVRPQADARGIELALTVEPAAGRLISDPRLVNQILLNLLSNAIKFTDDGSVSLDISTTGTEMALAVRDTGRGLSEEDIPHIMESFYQASPERKAKNEGTGLGLSISSKLAEMLKGRLTVESELGAGSTFTLRIPHRPRPRADG